MNKSMVMVAALAVVLAGCSGSVSFGERDDSDSATERSGMNVLTDHKTGLQYLESTNGGLTPRLDEEGKQMKAEQ